MNLPGLVRSFGIVALVVGAALAGTASGVVFAFVGDLPAISALDNWSPATITRVYGRDGTLVGDFATERRQIVAYDDIPEVLRQAIMSAEDGDFMAHGGLKVGRMLLAALQAVKDKLFSGARTPGRSTITQQLARQLFPDSVGFERSPERKIKEALVALQIEKRYTKPEVFTMYANKVYWGHGVYGVEAAARLYFGKSVRDVNLDEAAMLAGIIQGHQRQSPYVTMEAAVRRRNYTLGRMAAEGYITRDEAEAAMKRPIVTHGEPSRPPSMAPYFLEAVRQHLDDHYGAQAVYEGGLSVKTGLDPQLQRAASDALDWKLRQLDKLRGYRAPTRHVRESLSEKVTLDTYRHPRWTREPVEGDLAEALVMNIVGDTVTLRIGRWHGTLPRSAYTWTRRRAAQLAKPGDLLEVRVGTVNPEDNSFVVKTLEQRPLLQGAVLAIENRTGQVLAMVGGSSFEDTKFNRSMQALRQVGSLFKPFVYTTAIDRGYTALSPLDDVPTSFYAGPNQPPYEPKNYDRKFMGEGLTLRRALELSRNVPAIRLMDALGPPTVIEYAKRLGITAPLPPYLSVAIGSAEATLIEMVSAYAAYPNQGVRMKPQLVLTVNDREGNVLELHRPEPHEAIRADTAYVLAELMQGVVRHGTAASAASLDWPLGGKTGTTDDYTDAWFIGFDPDITVGVWIGYDQKRTIGNDMTGTHAALPVWKEIMKPWVERRRKELKEPPEFARPGNILIVNTEFGREVFIAGTEPGRGGH